MYKQSWGYMNMEWSLNERKERGVNLAGTWGIPLLINTIKTNSGAAKQLIYGRVESRRRTLLFN